MRAAAGFFLGELSLAVLGAGAAFHPSIRSLDLAARAAVAFAAGAVSLTLEATLFSIAGIPWTVASLGLPLLLASVAGALWWMRRPIPARRPIRIPRGLAAVSALVCALSLAYLALSFASSSATSVDFLYFWGVKAVRFTHARGFDAAFLRSPFAGHAVPDYPPLVPMTQAWGCLLAGRMPWRAAPSVSLLWAAAALPLIFEGLRRPLGDRLAAGLSAFWSAAMSVSLANSYSGGNAEAPLLFFESAAVAWLLGQDPADSRFAVGILLCGIVLTKVEGSAAVVFLAIGAFLRERGSPVRMRVRRCLALVAWPAAAVSTWFLYQASRSLPFGYKAHGRLLELHPANAAKVFGALFRNIDAGSLWLPWIIAILWLAARRSTGRNAAPAWCLSLGLLAFLAFDYLHDRRDPSERIGWTAPRVVQPSLSAAVLAAGLASARPARRRSGKSAMVEPLPDPLRNVAARIE